MIGTSSALPRGRPMASIGEVERLAFILNTSGTTGIPKGVVGDNGGQAVALRWLLPAIYGVQPPRGVLDGIGCRLGGLASHRPSTRRCCWAARP